MDVRGGLAGSTPVISAGGLGIPGYFLKLRKVSIYVGKYIRGLANIYYWLVRPGRYFRGHHLGVRAECDGALRASPDG